MIETPPPPTSSPRPPRGRGIASILDELKGDFAGVLGGTFALLRKELIENAEQIRKAARVAAGGAVMLAVGAFFIMIGLNLLAIDLLSPSIMSTKMAAWICTLASGTLLMAAGYVFTKRYADKINVENMIPDRTLESLENSFKWATDKAEEAMNK